MPWPSLKGFGGEEDAGINVDKLFAVRVKGERGDRDGTDDEGG